MLWERKIQIDQEMHDVLDPEVGQDVVTAMKKEIHRMELRHSELMKLQEKLIQVSCSSINNEKTIRMSAC